MKQYRSLSKLSDNFCCWQLPLINDSTNLVIVGQEVSYEYHYQDMNTLIWVVNIVSQWEWIEAVHVSNIGRLPWWLQPGSHLAPGHSQIYLEAMEKNREKAWYQYYVTDRKWWTQFCNDGKESTQYAASTASDCRCFADSSYFATKSLGNSVAKFKYLSPSCQGSSRSRYQAGMFDGGKGDREGREKRGKKTRENGWYFHFSCASS